VPPTARESWDALRDLAFPKLLRVAIFSPREHIELDTPHFKHFMPSGLRSIEFYNDFDPELLRHLQRHCPNLKRISMDWQGGRLNTKLLVQSLRVLPSITDISLEKIPNGFWAERDVFEYLARHEKLARLYLGCRIKKGLLKNIRVTNPFNALRKLSLRIEWSAAPLLVPMITSVHDFELVVEATDSRNAVIDSTSFRLFSNLNELRRLDIYMGPVLKILKDGFAFVTSLGHLPELTIRGWPLIMAAVGFKVRDFEHLIPYLFNSRVIDLPIGGLELTTASLVALGRSCPCLEELFQTESLTCRRSSRTRPHCFRG
jgi:hypothetical protein